MEWLKTLLLGEIDQTSHPEENCAPLIGKKFSKRNIAQQLVHKDKKIEALQNELGHQKLAIQALTRFLLKKEIINEYEFNQFIYEVDKEDGVVDQKLNIDPRAIKNTNSEKKAIPRRIIQKPHPNREAGLK